MKEVRDLEPVEARQGNDVLHAVAQIRSENLGSYSRLEPQSQYEAVERYCIIHNFKQEM